MVLYRSMYGRSTPLNGFFFFQAEDGIRDVAVTGVQTCALPILRFVGDRVERRHALARRGRRGGDAAAQLFLGMRERVPGARPPPVRAGAAHAPLASTSATALRQVSPHPPVASHALPHHCGLARSIAR